MRIIFPTLILCLLAVLLVPAEAWAWGPGIHMAAAELLLSKLGAVAPALAAFLPLQADAFIYGSISADIFMGKSAGASPPESHDWSTGLTLLESADDDALAAYAYGYLAHLAADTVSHNHYIPRLLCHAPTGGNIGHVWLEMQADMRIAPNGSEARRVFRTDQAEADESLISAVSENPMAFRLKKTLFKGGLVLFDSTWRLTNFSVVSSRLSRMMDDRELAEMFELSLNAAASVLRDPLSSPVLSLDPRGADNLRAAHRLRRGGRLLSLDKASLFPAPDALLELPYVFSPTPPLSVPAAHTGERLLHRPTGTDGDLF